MNSDAELKTCATAVLQREARRQAQQQATDDDNGGMRGNVKTGGIRMHSRHRKAAVEKGYTHQSICPGSPAGRMTVCFRPQTFTHYVNNQAPRGAPLLLPGVQKSRQLFHACGEESEVQLPLVYLAVFDDRRGSVTQIDDGKFGFAIVGFKSQQTRNGELALFQIRTSTPCRARTKPPPPRPGTLPYPVSCGVDLFEAQADEDESSR